MYLPTPPAAHELEDCGSHRNDFLLQLRSDQLRQTLFGTYPAASPGSLQHSQRLGLPLRGWAEPQHPSCQQHQGPAGVGASPQGCVCFSAVTQGFGQALRAPPLYSSPKRRPKVWSPMIFVGVGEQSMAVTQPSGTKSREVELQIEVSLHALSFKAPASV